MNILIQLFVQLLECCCQELARAHSELRLAARRNAELLQHSVEEAEEPDDDDAADDVDDEAADSSGIEGAHGHGHGLGLGPGVGVAVVAASHAHQNQQQKQHKGKGRPAEQLNESLESPLSLSLLSAGSPAHSPSLQAKSSSSLQRLPTSRPPPPPASTETFATNSLNSDSGLTDEANSIEYAI